MASPQALEILKQAMLQQQADQMLGPMIEQALGQFGQRFYGSAPMHVPEYRDIGYNDLRLDQMAPGYAQDQTFGKGMSEWDPAHKAMLLPNIKDEPIPKLRMPGTPDPNAPWGGGGYEDKTPLKEMNDPIARMLQQNPPGEPQMMDPNQFPGLEDFLSPGEW